MHLASIPPAWSAAPLVTFTYRLQPGVRDPWGNPVPDPAIVEARAHALADAAPGEGAFRRMTGSLDAVLAAAAALSDHAHGGTFDAHAVLQGADGAWYLTRLHSVSYGGRMEGSPSIDGRVLHHVVRSVEAATSTPELRAIVGGAGWMPVDRGVVGAYRPFASQR